MGFDTSLDKALARVEPSRPLSILPAQKIAALRPTQITIGMREVGAKLMKLDTSARPDRSALQRHLLPVILGPGQQLFLRDRHHLALALHRIGLESVGVALIADMSHMDIHAFWILLDRRNWVYPYDRMGTRRPFSEMPESVLALEDDPFRSLAGELRRMGGFAKGTAPYAEFAWTEYLRRRIPGDLVDENFDKALGIALKLARDRAAECLPGWCGENQGWPADHATTTLRGPSLSDLT